MLQLHLKLLGREMLHIFHSKHKVEHLVHKFGITKSQVDYCLNEGEDRDARWTGSRIPKNSEKARTYFIWEYWDVRLKYLYKLLYLFAKNSIFLRDIWESALQLLLEEVEMVHHSCKLLNMYIFINVINRYNKRYMIYWLTSWVIINIK